VIRFLVFHLCCQVWHIYHGRVSQSIWFGNLEEIVNLYFRMGPPYFWADLLCRGAIHIHLQNKKIKWYNQSDTNETKCDIYATVINKSK